LFVVAECSQLMGWPAAGRQSAVTGATSSGGGELASTSPGDVISEDWWLRFSDYRLEDYYAVQARLDNDAGRPFPTVPANSPPDAADIHQAVYGKPSSGSRWTCAPPTARKPRISDSFPLIILETLYIENALESTIFRRRIKQFSGIPTAKILSTPVVLG